MAHLDGTPVMLHLKDFLEKRQPPKTFCPSEVVRALSASELQFEGAAGWRELMPHVRGIVWQLRANGQCEVLQKGEVIGADVRLEDLKGPIRVRRVEN